MGSSTPASLSVDARCLQDSIKSGLQMMVIRHDDPKIFFSQVQFVFEAWEEGWIRKNFIDVAFSFCRLVVDCLFV
jgi:hypothetical protein